jgi:NhaA family Na+:H+ antiporter
MPETPVGRWLQPFAQFLKIQSASGFLLLTCTAIALLLANSPWSASFAEIWQIRLRLAVGNFELNKPLLLWINDGLMTVFFFVVGLEIKREFMMEELRDSRKAAFPIVAALGGMIVPAGIYLLFHSSQPGQSGWGIPVATDIAFVAGFLALLGSRVPASLKIMLGAVPIIIDPIFSGLAWSLIFGLFASTLFTLFVIPVVYWLLYANKPGHGLPQSSIE